jgi:hypothetical protein
LALSGFNNVTITNLDEGMSNQRQDTENIGRFSKWTELPESALSHPKLATVCR